MNNSEKTDFTCNKSKKWHGPSTESEMQVFSVFYKKWMYNFCLSSEKEPRYDKKGFEDLVPSLMKKNCILVTLSRDLTSQTSLKSEVEKGFRRIREMLI